LNPFQTFDVLTHIFDDLREENDNDNDYHTHIVNIHYAVPYCRHKRDDMSDDFAGQIALVTGAAAGIGAAVARALVEAGAQVIAIDIDQTGLDTQAQANADLTGQFHPHVVDISDTASVNQLVTNVESKIGAIDYLVNVAGILWLTDALDCTDEQWQRTFEVNTHGVFYLLRAVGRVMRPRQQGAIVTVSSNAAHIPRTKMLAYAASKAATTQLTRSFGLEMAEHGIRCNLVSPGSTDTAMQRQLWKDENGAQAVIDGNLKSYRNPIPLGRMGQAEDVAAAVLFLLSDQARQITLADILVDGGATLGL